MKRQQVGADRWGKQEMTRRQEQSAEAAAVSASCTAACLTPPFPTAKKQSAQEHTQSETQNCPSELKISQGEIKLFAQYKSKACRAVMEELCLSKAWSRQLKTATKYFRAKGLKKEGLRGGNESVARRTGGGVQIAEA